MIEPIKLAPWPPLLSQSMLADCLARAWAITVNISALTFSFSQTFFASALPTLRG
ncbi:hypothetical protein [Pseudomonas asplenii]|uniref:hypothetical protein n=1 Tax=Pseudomonas asplenii TaxID=53407 RepID=UPI0037C777D9